MPPKRFLLTFYMLTFILLTSCASAPDPRAVSVVQAIPTSTPFQPGVNSSPFNATQALPAYIATFTPYPTVYIRGGSVVLPQVATPSGETGLSSVAIDPLTGQLPSDPALLNRRPMAIKISNYPREIRPQYGLTLADVVFEYYIEWGDTRFIGIFYGNNAKQVGPVRSGRYFDEHIVRMYHAYYVFNFADPREYKYFISGDLSSFVTTPGNTFCPPFYTFRVSDKIVDINHYETYFDTTKFSDCLAKKGKDNSPQSIRSSFFNLSVPPGGAIVSRIFNNYSVDDYDYWQYDPASGRYLRFQETADTRDNKPESYAPLMDALTNKQVAADNVVELFVSHTFANENEQQDEVYHINLVNSGNAFVFRDGVAFPARWNRTDLNQPLYLSNLDGSPIYLKPGVTFYQVTGETTSDWSSGLDWHFDFHTP
jgi:hypothetical protein